MSSIVRSKNAFIVGGKANGSTPWAGNDISAEIGLEKHHEFFIHPGYGFVLVLISCAIFLHELGNCF
jgi:hypothetical protein